MKPLQGLTKSQAPRLACSCAKGRGGNAHPNKWFSYSGDLRVVHSILSSISKSSKGHGKTMPHARGPNIILNNYQSACGLPFILSSAGPPPPSTWVPQALLHPDHRAETWPDTQPRHSASSEHESYIPREKRHPANSTLHTSMGSHKAGPHSDKHREDSWDWNPL